jgi:hypothetical protein
MWAQRVWRQTAANLWAEQLKVDDGFLVETDRGEVVKRDFLGRLVGLFVGHSCPSLNKCLMHTYNSHAAARQPTNHDPRLKRALIVARESHLPALMNVDCSDIEKEGETPCMWWWEHKTQLEALACEHHRDFRFLSMDQHKHENRLEKPTSRLRNPDGFTDKSLS